MVVATVLSGRVSSAGRLPVPGKQVADAIDGKVGDAGEHVAQIGLWVEPAHLGGLDQGIHRGRANAAGIRAGKKVVFPGHRNQPFILPVSGRKWKFTTDGIRILAARSAFAAWSNVSGLLSPPCRRRAELQNANHPMQIGSHIWSTI
jgi:hypothetical protein